MPGPGEPPRTAEHRLAAGCVAGMALAAAATWLRFAADRTLRIEVHGWAFLAASAVAGGGLVLAGACSLRLAPRAHRLSWRALWGWAAAVQAVSWGALALTSSDVFTNLAFGTLSARGLSPYLHAPAALGESPVVALVPSRWVHDPSPYGPLFVPFARAAARAGALLGSPVWGTFFAYKAILLLSVVATLAIVARHLRATSRGDAAETFAVLALGPVLPWEITAQGHNDGLLVLAIAACVAAAAAGRQLLAAAAVAAGVGVKYAVAPLLALHLVLVGRRSIARAVAAAAVAGAVLAAAFLPEARAVTLRAVLPMVGGETARHAHSLTDLVCLVLDALRLPGASLVAYRLLSAASALVCGMLLLRAAWSARTVGELAHGFLLFLMGLYLTAPWFQPWYVCWALPLLAAEPDPRWRRFVALFAVVTVAQWAAPLDPVTTVAGDAWAAWRIWRLRQEGAEIAAPAAAA